MSTDSSDRPSDKRSQAYRDDRAHVFHSWSAQAHLDPLVITGGEGAWVWDEDGRRFLDFSSQLMNVNIGHQHPKLLAAIHEQTDLLTTVAPIHANPARSEAARLIAERAPGDLDAVFFTNGGAEANENAIRLARLHTGRHKVLATYRSYHGATGGSITLTGDPRRWPSEPGIPGVVHFWAISHSAQAMKSPPWGGLTLPPPLPTPPARRCRPRGPWPTWPTRSWWRVRRPSRRSSWSRWWAPTASSCRPRATWPGCATCATSTGSCSSLTR